jgi:L-rhamnose-H+ transport protein
MALDGVLLAALSGLCNGLFTAPMKLIRIWKWEHIWLVFIVTACLLMPAAMVLSADADRVWNLLRSGPRQAVWIAALFGFAWGFGAILFGRSVDRLGVSLANSLVIGISSALGSVVPLLFQGSLHLDRRVLTLLFGVAAFLAGVALCGAAGKRRGNEVRSSVSGPALVSGYLFCIGAGVMSAVFNIGYTLALPLAEAGVRAGFSRFAATNVIWLFMLGAGSIPNIVYCGWLVKSRREGRLFANPGSGAAWAWSIGMGLLWGGSIFLYGAATPLLGDIGPSIGWPLSLAVGLLVANLMGVLLGEWRGAATNAVIWMRSGIAVLLVAIALCAWSASIGS